MFAELRKRLSRGSPRVAIAAGLLIAFAAGSGVALLLMRGGEKVDADDTVQPMAARIDRVDGSVAIARVIDENTEPDWDEATINTPVSVGDRIYTRDNSRASVALTGHNFVRLDPGASLDVLELGDRRTQLALRSGLGVFDVGALELADFYEVATPCGAVDFSQPGLYQIGIDGDGNTAIISVLSGLAEVVGASGSGYIDKGEVYTLVGSAASEVVASTLAPTLAGGIVDDYYRYRHPSVYDGRYRSYDTYVSDPFYYDPYRSSASYRYVSADIPGLHDLDYYGDWTNIDGYGHCWAPRVSSGWAPFRSGSWDLYDAWGPTWVSHEPWGWAPYHYGRWTFVQQRWFWVPVEVRTRRSYCPATVAFIPLAQDQIAWVPLAPGEVYVPRYYDASFRPRYLASREVIREVTVQRTFVNLNEPSAVTVVPVRALKHRIEPSLIAQVDPQVIRRSKPTLDAFQVGGVRDLAIRSKGEGRKLRLARAEQQAFARPVLTSRRPASLPADTNLPKALRVEPLSGDLKQKRLKIDRTGQVISDRRPDGLPQANAPNQVRTGKDREQRGNPAAAQPPAAQQRVQQEQLRQQMREQLKTERQQQSGAASQAEAARRAQQQQMRQQQKEHQKRPERTPPEARKPPEASVQHQQRTGQLRQQQQIQQQSGTRAQQEAARQSQQQRQQMQNQQRKQEKPPQRKPPEASVRQQQQIDQGSQITKQARIRAQQEAARQQGQARQQQQRTMIEQQNRMAARQSQAREQFKPRDQQQQRQTVVREQAARPQASPQQTARPERPQHYVGPPAR